ncbi:hypothetical protein Pla175_44760 [Pirellulimonas nuda]|uniref:Sialate O-acetylesterase domain-containing protein n=1 Tax=Pirellulimonas nuda TaxID=2528009 RepID=A0A518DHU9_9BACT|nr:sialate O-acetylesterase [Pirellulimonas nuda]QDU91059.1 hypothetical protein Pla175_44760 [Pirellulimonas nuda]
MKACFWVASCLVLSNSALALDLSMPSIFADHMVLQRNQQAPVWGTADAGAAVVVEFGAQQKHAVADADGRWRVDLDPLEASSEARVLRIAATLADDTAAREIADVVVGEVWLCGGQSNMYRPFRMLVGPAVDPAYEPVAEYLRDEAANANDPLLRQYRVGPDYSPLEARTQGRGNWSRAAPREVNEFCGTAYFFGRQLRRELGVPVALISCNLGATRIEPWMPPQAFESGEALKQEYQSSLAAYQNRLEQWDDDRERAKYARALEEWKKARAQARRAPKEPQKPEHPSRDKQFCGTLYHGMVRPLIPYAVKGAIWYQGESNSGYLPEQYGRRMVALIQGWRAAWGQEEFYFYWCQLASYRSANDDPVGDEDTWALVQDGQRYALKLPDTGMAVLNDIGEARDVHPKNKVDAGKRLALWALKQAYGRDIVCSGPLFREAKASGSRVVVAFDHAGSGLMVGRKQLMAPTQEVDEPLKRFQICGSDGRWRWAEARIVGTDSVEVWHDEVPHPVEVRYAWSSNPEGANLYNKEGLPASLFKTTNLRLQDEAPRQTPYR